MDVKYLEKVLPYIQQLWGRPVHIETQISEKQMVLTYDEKQIQKVFVGRNDCLTFLWWQTF